MTSYKEKIQKQLKKSLEGFRNSQNRSLKTSQIQKQFKKRKVIRPRSNYYEHLLAHKPQEREQTLNFYNILTVNERALIDEDYCVSYLQTNFFSKTIKKIEVKENYIVLFLHDSTYIQPSIQETLTHFKSSEHQPVRIVGHLLSDLAKKMEINTITQDTSISLTAQAFEMLDSLGDTPFLCKIFSEKLVISKSLLALKEVNSDDFILQCLKSKLPLLQVFTTKNYFQLIRKQIDFYSGLMEVLRGCIPFCSFLEGASMDFTDTITSKNNTEHLCEMSLTMPIPLVELIKVENILDSKYCDQIKTDELFGDKLKKYQDKFKSREHTTLQHFVSLQKNCMPESYNKVAGYIEISVDSRSEEEERKSVTASLYDKNSQTCSHS